MSTAGVVLSYLSSDIGSRSGQSEEEITRQISSLKAFMTFIAGSSSTLFVSVAQDGKIHATESLPQAKLFSSVSVQDDSCACSVAYINTGTTPLGNAASRRDLLRSLHVVDISSSSLTSYLVSLLTSVSGGSQASRTLLQKDFVGVSSDYTNRLRTLDRSLQFGSIEFVKILPSASMVASLEKLVATLGNAKATINIPSVKLFTRTFTEALVVAQGRIEKLLACTFEGWSYAAFQQRAGSELVPQGLFLTCPSADSDSGMLFAGASVEELLRLSLNFVAFAYDSVRSYAAFCKLRLRALDYILQDFRDSKEMIEGAHVALCEKFPDYVVKDAAAWRNLLPYETALQKRLRVCRTEDEFMDSLRPLYARGPAETLTFPQLDALMEALSTKTPQCLALSSLEVVSDGLRHFVHLTALIFIFHLLRLLAALAEGHSRVRPHAQEPEGAQADAHAGGGSAPGDAHQPNQVVLLDALTDFQFEQVILALERVHRLVHRMGPLSAGGIDTAAPRRFAAYITDVRRHLESVRLFEQIVESSTAGPGGPGGPAGGLAGYAPAALSAEDLARLAAMRGALLDATRFISSYSAAGVTWQTEYPASNMLNLQLLYGAAALAERADDAALDMGDDQPPAHPGGAQPLLPPPWIQYVGFFAAGLYRSVDGTAGTAGAAAPAEPAGGAHAFSVALARVVPVLAECAEYKECMADFDARFADFLGAYVVSEDMSLTNISEKYFRMQSLVGIIGKRPELTPAFHAVKRSFVATFLKVLRASHNLVDLSRADLQVAAAPDHERYAAAMRALLVRTLEDERVLADRVSRLLSTEHLLPDVMRVCDAFAATGALALPPALAGVLLADAACRRLEVIRTISEDDPDIARHLDIVRVNYGDRGAWVPRLVQNAYAGILDAGAARAKAALQRPGTVADGLLHMYGRAPDALMLVFSGDMHEPRSAATLDGAGSLRLSAVDDGGSLHPDALVVPGDAALGVANLWDLFVLSSQDDALRLALARPDLRLFAREAVVVSALQTATRFDYKGAALFCVPTSFTAMFVRAVDAVLCPAVQRYEGVVAALRQTLAAQEKAATRGRAGFRALCSFDHTAFLLPALEAFAGALLDLPVFCSVRTEAEFFGSDGGGAGEGSGSSGGGGGSAGGAEPSRDALFVVLYSAAELSTLGAGVRLAPLYAVLLNDFVLRSATFVIHSSMASRRGALAGTADAVFASFLEMCQRVYGLALALADLQDDLTGMAAELRSTMHSLAVCPLDDVEEGVLELKYTSEKMLSRTDGVASEFGLPGRDRHRRALDGFRLMLVLRAARVLAAKGVHGLRAFADRFLGGRVAQAVGAAVDTTRAADVALKLCVPPCIQYANTLAPLTVSVVCTGRRGSSDKDGAPPGSCMHQLAGDVFVDHLPETLCGAFAEYVDGIARRSLCAKMGLAAPPVVFCVQALNALLTQVHSGLGDLGGLGGATPAGPAAEADGAGASSRLVKALLIRPDDYEAGAKMTSFATLVALVGLFADRLAQMLAVLNQPYDADNFPALCTRLAHAGAMPPATLSLLVSLHQTSLSLGVFRRCAATLQRCSIGLSHRFAAFTASASAMLVRWCDFSFAQGLEAAWAADVCAGMDEYARLTCRFDDFCRDQEQRLRGDSVPGLLRVAWSPEAVRYVVLHAERFRNEATRAILAVLAAELAAVGAKCSKLLTKYNTRVRRLAGDDAAAEDTGAEVARILTDPDLILHTVLPWLKSVCTLERDAGPLLARVQAFAAAHSLSDDAPSGGAGSGGSAGFLASTSSQLIEERRRFAASLAGVDQRYALLLSRKAAFIGSAGAGAGTGAAGGPSPKLLAEIRGALESEDLALSEACRVNLARFGNINDFLFVLPQSANCDFGRLAVHLVSARARIQDLATDVAYHADINDLTRDLFGRTLAELRCPVFLRDLRALRATIDAVLAEAARLGQMSADFQASVAQFAVYRSDDRANRAQRAAADTAMALFKGFRESFRHMHADSLLARGPKHPGPHAHTDAGAGAGEGEGAAAGPGKSGGCNPQHCLLHHFFGEYIAAVCKLAPLMLQILNASFFTPYHWGLLFARLRVRSGDVPRHAADLERLNLQSILALFLRLLDNSSASSEAAAYAFLTPGFDPEVFASFESVSTGRGLTVKTHAVPGAGGADGTAGAYTELEVVEVMDATDSEAQEPGADDSLGASDAPSPAAATATATATALPRVPLQALLNALESIIAEAKTRYQIQETIDRLKSERSAFRAALSAGSDVPLVTNWAELITSVEEHLNYLQDLQSSPYYKEFAADVDQLSRQLTGAARVFKVFAECQKNYVNLRSVLSGNLGVMRKYIRSVVARYEFSVADLEAVLRELREAPLIMDVVGGDPDVFAFRLDNIQAGFEQTQKCLADFLELQRLVSPRLFFLTDGDVLELIAYVSNSDLASLQRLWSKLFPGISTVQAAAVAPGAAGYGDGGGDGGGDGAPRTLITAFVSKEGEVFALDAPLDFTSYNPADQALTDELPIHRLLVDVQAVMQRSLRAKILDASQRWGAIYAAATAAGAAGAADAAGAREEVARLLTAVPSQASTITLQMLYTARVDAIFAQAFGRAPSAFARDVLGSARARRDHGAVLARAVGDMARLGAFLKTACDVAVSCGEALGASIHVIVPEVTFIVTEAETYLAKFRALAAALAADGAAQEALEAYSDIQIRWDLALKFYLTHTRDAAAPACAAAPAGASADALASPAPSASSALPPADALALAGTDAQAPAPAPGDIDVHVTLSSATLAYGFEWLGAAPRIIQTDLTNYCYLIATQALAYGYGISPLGQAGTGKSETTKNLATLLGRLCFVFNADENFDVVSVNRILTGVCRIGSFVCFDEFNRLSESNLSAVSLKIQDIQTALREYDAAGATAGPPAPDPDQAPDAGFVHPHTGIFVTMNPGYAGRKELPQNVRSLFREVTMNRPDISRIVEILLFTAGVRHCAFLAQKVLAFFVNCSMLMSSQNHYDWGLRCIKSSVVAASRYSRAFDGAGADADTGAGAQRLLLHEAESTLRGIYATVLPKLAIGDVGVFYNLVQEVFSEVFGASFNPRNFDVLSTGSAGPTGPGTGGGGGGGDAAVVRAQPAFNINTLELNFAAFKRHIAAAILQRGLTPTDDFVTKVMQVHICLTTNTGTILLGESGTGKSASLSVYLDVMARVLQPLRVQLRRFYLSPKALRGNDEIYGRLVPSTREWVDGIFTAKLREFLDDPASAAAMLVVVFDADIDPLWIEQLNSVMDENRCLTLPSGERLVLTPNVKLVFETKSLEHTTLATVSRSSVSLYTPGVISHAALYASFLRRLCERVDISTDRVPALTLPDYLLSCASDVFVQAVEPFMGRVLQAVREGAPRPDAALGAGAAGTAQPHTPHAPHTPRSGGLKRMSALAELATEDAFDDALRLVRPLLRHTTVWMSPIRLMGTLIELQSHDFAEVAEWLKQRQHAVAGKMDAKELSLDISREVLAGREFRSQVLAFADCDTRTLGLFVQRRFILNLAWTLCMPFENRLRYGISERVYNMFLTRYGGSIYGDLYSGLVPNYTADGAALSAASDSTGIELSSAGDGPDSPDRRLFTGSPTNSRVQMSALGRSLRQSLLDRSAPENDSDTQALRSRADGLGGQGQGQGMHREPPADDAQDFNTTNTILSYNCMLGVDGWFQMNGTLLSDLAAEATGAHGLHRSTSKSNLRVTRTILATRTQNIQASTDPVDIHEIGCKIIQTTDTLIYTSLIEVFLRCGRSFILSGRPGSGKSLLLNSLLANNAEYDLASIAFSAATGPRDIVRILCKHCDLVPVASTGAYNLRHKAAHRKLVLFVDEINLPSPDAFSCQRAIEFLRFLLEHRYYVDGDLNACVHLDGSIIVAGTCNPSADSGRNELDDRFTRSIPVVYMDYPTTSSLDRIFTCFAESVLRSRVPALYGAPLTTRDLAYVADGQYAGVGVGAGLGAGAGAGGGLRGVSRSDLLGSTPGAQDRRLSRGKSPVRSKQVLSRINAINTACRDDGDLTASTLDVPAPGAPGAPGGFGTPGGSSGAAGGAGGASAAELAAVLRGRNLLSVIVGKLLVEVFTGIVARLDALVPYYLFTPRELTRCVLALNTALAGDATLPDLAFLLYHELVRTYCDRLATAREVRAISAFIADVVDARLVRALGLPGVSLGGDDGRGQVLFTSLHHELASGSPASPGGPPVLLDASGSFQGLGGPGVLGGGSASRLGGRYERVTLEQMRLILDAVLPEYLDHLRDAGMVYLTPTAFSATRIVLHDEAVCSIVKLDRVFRQPNGHVLLAGAPGSGKKLLARFVAWLNQCDYVELNTHAGYSLENLRETLRDLVVLTGAKHQRACLLIDESTNLPTSFIEYINGLLTSGEIVGLFEGDALSALVSMVATDGATADKRAVDGYAASKVLRTVARGVMQNLHVVFVCTDLTLSARTRAISPALFNRTTLILLRDWSFATLLHVGASTLADLHGVVDSNSLFAAGAHAGVAGVAGVAGGPAGPGGSGADPGPGAACDVPGTPEFAMLARALSEMEADVDADADTVRAILLASADGLSPLTRTCRAAILLHHAAVGVARSLENVHLASVPRALLQNASYKLASPRHFLRALAILHIILAANRSLASDAYQHISGGLRILDSMNAKIDALSSDMRAKTALLEEKKHEAGQKLALIASRKADARARQQDATAIADQIQAKQREIQLRRARVEEELGSVWPLIAQARSSIQSISKPCLDELKSLARPSDPVKLAVEAVILIIGGPDERANMEWTSIRKVMRREDFIHRILNYDTEKGELPAATVHKLADYAANPLCSEQAVMKASRAAGPMMSWVLSIYKFSSITQQIGPLEAEVESLARDSEQLQGRHQDALREVDAINDSLGGIEEEYSVSLREQSALDALRADAERSLLQARNLFGLLEDEQQRWRAELQAITEHIQGTLGSYILYSFHAVYACAYPQEKRAELVRAWEAVLDAFGVRHTTPFDFARTGLSIGNLLGLRQEGDGPTGPAGPPAPALVQAAAPESAGSAATAGAAGAAAPAGLVDPATPGVPGGAAEPPAPRNPGLAFNPNNTARAADIENLQDQITRDNLVALLSQPLRTPVLVVSMPQRDRQYVMSVFRKNSLVTSCLSPDLRHHVERAAKFGFTLFVEDVDDYNPLLNQPLLATALELNGKLCEVSDRLRVVLFAKAVGRAASVVPRCTVLNFAATASSLTALISATVVRTIWPDIHEARRSAADEEKAYNAKLRSLEKDLLRLLSGTTADELLASATVVSSLRYLKDESAKVAAKRDRVLSVGRSFETKVATIEGVAAACSEIFFGLQRLPQLQENAYVDSDYFMFVLSDAVKAVALRTADATSEDILDAIVQRLYEHIGCSLNSETQTVLRRYLNAMASRAHTGASMSAPARANAAAAADVHTDTGASAGAAAHDLSATAGAAPVDLEASGSPRPAGSPRGPPGDNPLALSLTALAPAQAPRRAIDASAAELPLTQFIRSTADLRRLYLVIISDSTDPSTLVGDTAARLGVRSYVVSYGSEESGIAALARHLAELQRRTRIVVSVTNLHLAPKEYNEGLLKLCKDALAASADVTFLLTAQQTVTITAKQEADPSENLTSLFTESLSFYVQTPLFLSVQMQHMYALACESVGRRAEPAGQTPAGAPGAAPGVAPAVQRRLVCLAYLHSVLTLRSVYIPYGFKRDYRFNNVDFDYALLLATEVPEDGLFLRMLVDTAYGNKVCYPLDKDVLEQLVRAIFCADAGSCSGSGGSSSSVPPLQPTFLPALLQALRADPATDVGHWVSEHAEQVNGIASIFLYDAVDAFINKDTRERVANKVSLLLAREYSPQYSRLVNSLLCSSPASSARVEASGPRHSLEEVLRFFDAHDFNPIVKVYDTTFRTHVRDEANVLIENLGYYKSLVRNEPVYKLERLITPLVPQLGRFMDSYHAITALLDSTPPPVWADFSSFENVVAAFNSHKFDLCRKHRLCIDTTELVLVVEGGGRAGQAQVPTPSEEGFYRSDLCVAVQFELFGAATGGSGGAVESTVCRTMLATRKALATRTTVPVYLDHRRTREVLKCAFRSSDTAAVATIGVFGGALALMN